MEVGETGEKYVFEKVKGAKVGVEGKEEKEVKARIAKGNRKVEAYNPEGIFLGGKSGRRMAETCECEPRDLLAL